MSYTPELEKWVRKNTLVSDLQRPEVDAHFWLSAFVRLVEEEANLHCGNAGGLCQNHLGEGFTVIVERFGLREEKP